MPKNVIQKAVFPTTPERLYAMYLNPKEHAAFTGSPVTIQNKVGAPFKAFHGALTGQIIFLDPGKTIVQRWRSRQFHKSDRDSILVLNFSKKGTGAEINLAHLYVPDHDYRGIKKGWPSFYWKPWGAYLKRKKHKRLAHRPPL